jgi:hypothetical protein
MPHAAPLPLLAAWAFAFTLLASGLSSSAFAQQAPSVSGGSEAKVAQAKAAPLRISPTAREESSPRWNELKPAQQAALAPLGGTWKTLSEAHKRKWLALSRNYARMSADDKARLHGRMTEWAALSPQQRTQARLNFADTKKVAVPDKKAAWEAYQQLSPEEKRKLAAGAAAAKPPPPPTAPAVKPVPPQKLTHVPQRKAARTPGLAVPPNQVDQNTLLPQPAAPRAPQN